MQPRLTKLFFHQLQKATARPCFSSLYQLDRSKNRKVSGWYDQRVPIQWFSGSNVSVLYHLGGKTWAIIIHVSCSAKLAIGRNSMQLRFCPALINGLCPHGTRDSCFWQRQATAEISFLYEMCYKVFRLQLLQKMMQISCIFTWKMLSGKASKIYSGHNECVQLLTFKDFRYCKNLQFICLLLVKLV